ncbi:MAG: hypothetical protein H0U27_04960 [Nitrosopumilus sp.]|nr:hypothetical protein [Nitrosopumilus sp.]
MKKTQLIKSLYKSNEISIEDLINYLNKIGGKALATKCKRQNSFKTFWKENETTLISRCHVQNASDYLMFIKDVHSKNQITIVIADILQYVRILDPFEDISFVLNTNTQPSAIHFDCAKRLFYTHNIRLQYQKNYTTDLLSIYALRLSLESRIRGFLGIDYATIKGKNIGLSTFIKISKQIKSVEYTKEVNWDEIELVNKWLNHHMHRHIRPYPWLIHQAIEVLKLFIDPKEPIIKNNRTIYSFYSATYVVDEKKLENEIVEILTTQYNEIKIKWLCEREILTSSKNAPNMLFNIP